MESHDGTNNSIMVKRRLFVILIPYYISNKLITIKYKLNSYPISALGFAR